MKVPEIYKDNGTPITVYVQFTLHSGAGFILRNPQFLLKCKVEGYDCTDQLVGVRVNDAGTPIPFGSKHGLMSEHIITLDLDIVAKATRLYPGLKHGGLVKLEQVWDDLEEALEHTTDIEFTKTADHLVNLINAQAAVKKIKFRRPISLKLRAKIKAANKT